MADNEEAAKGLAKKLSEFLEGAFEHIALSRRRYFEAKPGARRSKDAVEQIIASYANQNAMVAGTMSLVPGPFGLLTIAPELTLVLRNQIQMIYDLGVAHGKESQLNSRLLLGIFASAMGGGAIGLVAASGGKVVVKRASLRVIQKVIVMLGGKITQRVLKQLLTRYVPVAGALAMAFWARRTTSELGREASRLLEGELVVETGEGDG